MEEFLSSLQSQFLELEFANQERERQHNPYDQELREFSAIEQGNLKWLSESIAEVYPGEIGTLAKTPLRQAKNLAIVNITLASRAAIRGGVLPELCYSLSDAYIQKAEECTKAREAIRLYRTAEFQYAKLVHDLGGCNINPNRHIEACKHHIHTHLHERLAVSAIARELGLHPNYLSELFRKTEGCTIKQYILREKVGQAKSLLMYSDRAFSEIAHVLGFSSQSHLGKCFKEETGMTLFAFRNRYGSQNLRKLSENGKNR